MPSIKDFSVGDRVYFGRGRGEQTLGTVVKVNRVKLKVRQDEARGTKRAHRIGSVWTVPPSLCRKVEGNAPAAGTPDPKALTAPKAKPDPFPMGSTVEFEGYSFALRGSGTLTGVVTLTKSSGLEVYADGRFHNLHDTTGVKIGGRRPDDKIVRECGSVYGSLSPENLSCDGELSRTAVRAKAARLKRALKALWKEAGREITEGETWKAWEAARAASNG